MNRKTMLSLCTLPILCAVAGSSILPVHTHSVIAHNEQITPAVQQTIPLNYAPVPRNQNVQKISIQKPIQSLTPAQVGKLIPNAEKVFPARTIPKVGTVLFFQLKGDPENLHAAFFSGNALYNLGTVGGLESEDATKASVANLFGVPSLRIQGVYGANDLETNYFKLDRNTPSPLIAVNGTVQEYDLDGDGTKELIATHGLPPITSLYKWSGNRFVSVNLNRKLKAVSVSPHENDPSLFDVVFAANQAPVTYKYTKNNTLQQTTPSS